MDKLTFDQALALLTGCGWLEDTARVFLGDLFGRQDSVTWVQVLDRFMHQATYGRMYPN